MFDFGNAKVVNIFLPSKYFSHFFEKIFGCIKKPRKSLELRGEDDDAGGVEMGGAPPAALKEWFGCDAAKIAKLSYMRKAEKLSAR